MEEVKLKDEERTRCEIYTRVMGYHRPISEFNIGKKSEHAERRYFVESKGGRSFFGTDSGMPSDVPGGHPAGGGFRKPVCFSGLVA